MKPKSVGIVRALLLFFFTAYISVEVYLHQVLGGDKSPSVHALCPYGGLESLYKFFDDGSFIQKILMGTMLLFFISVALAILFRRSFCGLICPFGAIQEFFGKIGNWLFKKKFIMPYRIDRSLRYLKYVILIITAVFAWKESGLWMSPYDPWAAFAHLPEGLATVWEEFPIGFILLIITVLGSLVYDRFFCKYLCPMGALYAIIGKISPMKIERNESACVHCGNCSQSCPMNIDVENIQKVTSAECINCQTCVLSCPEKDALQMKAGKKSFQPMTVIASVMIFFFGLIYVFEWLGIYQVLPKSLAVGETIKIEEVKGYMTIMDASKATKLELKEFYHQFKIPESVPDNTKLKEIKNIVPEYNFEKVKEMLKK